MSLWLENLNRHKIGSIFVTFSLLFITPSLSALKTAFFIKNNFFRAWNFYCDGYQPLFIFQIEILYGNTAPQRTMATNKGGIIVCFKP